MNFYRALFKKLCLEKPKHWGLASEKIASEHKMNGCFKADSGSGAAKGCMSGFCFGTLDFL